MFSVMLLNPIFLLLSLVIVSIRCLSDLPSLSSRHTTRVSPFLTYSRASCNPFRSSFAPLITSVKIFVHPIFSRAPFCRFKVCSLVETLAYPINIDVSWIDFFWSYCYYAHAMQYKYLD